MQISLIKMFGFTGSQSVHGVTHDAPPPILRYGYVQYCIGYILICSHDELRKF